MKRVTMRTARVPHRCDSCKGAINPGERYAELVYGPGWYGISRGMSGCPMGGKCRPVCVQFKPLVVACYKCARIITGRAP